MVDQTDTLALPYILPSQAQKHVTHNEALAVLDAIVQVAVIDRDLTAPPGSPSAGDRYIPAATATGDWAGHEDEIAVWRDGAWVFFPPIEGWLAWIADEDINAVWDGAAWIVAGGTKGQFDTVGIGGAAADDTNRLAANADATLLSHDGNGHQLKINKAVAGDTGSVLFQTGFSGRAEFGLTGDDDWHVKVSADGSAWTDAIFVDKDNGYVGVLNQAPSEALHVGGKLQLEDASAAAAIFFNPTATPPANTIIGQFTYRGKDDAGNDNNYAAFRGYVLDDTNGSEEGYLTFRIQIAGALQDAVAIKPAAMQCLVPVQLPSHTVAGAPSASAAGAGAMIFASDETGGAVPAFSDGTNWRRVTDRAVIS